MPHKLFDLPRILRATVPIVTSPDPRSTTGLGDINMFNLLLFKAGPVELLSGRSSPSIRLPMTGLGTGKWQAGAAGFVLAPQPWGMLGRLVPININLPRTCYWTKV